MDIEEELVQLTNEVKEHVKILRKLEAVQPSEEESAQVVALVVPVVAMMPTPAAMEIDAAPPASTMGPGRAPADSQMPEIFAKRVRPEDEAELSDYMEEDEGERPVAAPLPPIGFFQHPQDPVDEGDFDDDKEQKLIVSLTVQHDRPILWRAQCITIWKQLMETAAEANQLDPTNP